MDNPGLLSRVPKVVLYALAIPAAALVFAAVLVSVALREAGALLMGLIPVLWLCMFRLELRDRARR